MCNVFYVLDCSLRECSDVVLSYDTGDDIRETLSVVPSRSVVLQVRICVSLSVVLSCSLRKFS